MVKSRDPLIVKVVNFLDGCLAANATYLLAFSGGPDSLALLHLLLLSRTLTHNKFDIALAHVDHGWRVESKEEVKVIREMAEKYGVQLHLKTLNPETMQGNLEAACREERYRFFKELCNEYGYSGVFLGHHGDDLAETVLKRLFEGASLVNLQGMQPLSEFEGIFLIRPLLSIKKRQILAWLEKKGLRGFDDYTNLDPKYMRGRLRTAIIPKLTEVFGKDVASGLCAIAEEASQLKEFLDSETDPYLKGCYRKGTVDFSVQFPLSQVILKHLLKRIFQLEKLLISRDALELMILHLQNNSSKKYVVAGERKILIDKRHLYIQRTQSGVEGE